MKKVSCKVFFTVMWRGICQVLGWFFGLFGYKRDGKFAKCVWGLFSISAAIIMALLACAAIYGVYESLSDRYSEYFCHDYDEGQFVSRTIGYVEDYDGNNGFLINKKTGKKVLKGIDWIAKPLCNDTLICFSKHGKRGYFNMKDGKVVIEPKYNHAWIFSDGVAAVEEEGKIKFIDGTGKVVLDANIKYDSSTDDYVFHGGYLIVENEDGGKYGLIDKSGKLILEKVYDEIRPSNNLDFWRVRKDDKCAVYDKDMNVILPFIDGWAFLTDECIAVTMSDHTMRMYDYDGNLINDFCIDAVFLLEYEKEEILYRTNQDVDDEEQSCESYHPKATARLRHYTAGDGYGGLMTPDGHIITMPLYEDIEAVGYDTYLCTVNNGDKVIVDGKGQIVR